MKPFAVYLLLKYLQGTVKIFLRKMPLPMFFQHGAHMIKFSRFLKITLNKLVKKFASFEKFAKKSRNLFCGNA